MSTPRVSSNRNRKQSRKERESERKKKMRRSLVDTIMSRIHTSAALSDGPRGDPRRSETVRAPPRQTSLLSLRDHKPRASRFRNDPRDTRTRSAPRPIGEHGATFRQIVSRKRATKNTHLANLLVLLREVVERHGSKINWRPVSLPLAPARAKETRKWRPLLCAVRKGFK